MEILSKLYLFLFKSIAIDKLYTQTHELLRFDAWVLSYTNEKER